VQNLLQRFSHAFIRVFFFASAWITPGVDDPAIKTLLSGFYPKVKGQ
jgi:hypothetical protein